jgi:hypothetical protein
LKTLMPTPSPDTSQSSTGATGFYLYGFLQPKNCNDCDSMSRLDKWRTTLLLTIKKKIGEQDFS